MLIFLSKKKFTCHGKISSAFGFMAIFNELLQVDIENLVEREIISTATYYT